jgi:hypothetical protein
MTTDDEGASKHSLAAPLCSIMTGPFAPLFIIIIIRQHFFVFHDSFQRPFRNVY